MMWEGGIWSFPCAFLGVRALILDPGKLVGVFWGAGSKSTSPPDLAWFSCLLPPPHPCPQLQVRGLNPGIALPLSNCGWGQMPLTVFPPPSLSRDWVIHGVPGTASSPQSWA